MYRLEEVRPVPILINHVATVSIVHLASEQAKNVNTGTCTLIYSPKSMILLFDPTQKITTSVIV